MIPDRKTSSPNYLPRWHHDNPVRRAQRTASLGVIRQRHLIRHNPFQHCRILSPTAPIVVRTEYKFDAPALIASIIKYFGIRHAFSSGELVLRLGELTPRRIGHILSEIANAGSFNSYLIERIDDDRDGAVWWVTPAS